MFWGFTTKKMLSVIPLSEKSISVPEEETCIVNQMFKEKWVTDKAMYFEMFLSGLYLGL